MRRTAPVTVLFAVLTCVSPTTPLGAQAPAGPPAAAAPTTNLGNTTDPNSYRIGAGDVLEINVWKEPEASVSGVVVRPDGKITLPLLKEVEVNGLTPADVQKLLVSKLDPQFIHGADVTVVVKDIRSKKVYLIGAVKREGPIPLLSNMTVLQVLAEAGGLTDFAKRKKIYILRHENGHQKKLPFNYDQVIKGEHMDQNILIRPDDTIVVPH
jgi:polysaccharide export outer membrane protein